MGLLTGQQCCSRDCRAQARRCQRHLDQQPPQRNLIGVVKANLHLVNQQDTVSGFCRRQREREETGSPFTKVFQR